jgi:hypothetical protein
MNKMNINVYKYKHYLTEGNMHTTNLEERVIVKLGSILQSRRVTKEEVLAAYAEAEDDCVEEIDENLDIHNEE